MKKGDVVFETLHQWIRKDKTVCSEVCGMKIIANAGAYLKLPSSTTLPASSSNTTLAPSTIPTEKWIGVDSDIESLTLAQKTALMGLLRTIVGAGGALRDIEGVLEGANSVSKEVREREEESAEGEEAEMEAELLTWMIEKRKNGRNTKSRRELSQRIEELQKSQPSEYETQERMRETALETDKHTGVEKQF